MTEINKPEIKIAQPAASNVHHDKTVEIASTKDIAKDYKEAAAAPGAEAAGRAMIMINKSKKLDNIENDINKIIANPRLLDQSEVMFRAAEKAGIAYPEAASFATSELG